MIERASQGKNWPCETRNQCTANALRPVSGHPTERGGGGGRGKKMGGGKRWGRGENNPDDHICFRFSCKRLLQTRSLLLSGWFRKTGQV